MISFDGIDGYDTKVLMEEIQKYGVGAKDPVYKPN
ncbi:hypothetical protein XBKQ1_120011 [Xenorhabdus bovienii str. kraussei Quebec]|uniref:Uncharacterized protein n=2 Tax=Xenorhabdus bovienii TaxID=40576 RepID=A0A077PFC9_XENBV|nr:hypothetical protein XBKQ1_120011 [Xenorhabdus bovienii str. kraussei Quebec]